MKHFSLIKTIAATFGVSFLTFQPMQAESTYRLVTNNDMIIDRCVYLLVAEDLNIAAANEMNSPSGIKTTAITRSGNGIISLPDKHSVGEYSIFYTELQKTCDCGSPELHVDYPWTFRPLFSNDYLTYYYTDGIKTGPLAIKPRRYHYYTTVDIDPESHTCATSFYLEGAKANCYGLWFKEESGEYILNTYAPETDGLHRMQLYRKEIYDLRVLEIKKTDNTYNIKIHVNTFDESNDYSKGHLMYIFSDEEVLFNDDIYRDPETIILRNYNAGDFEINYTGSKKYLWLIRDHGPNERLTDAIKVEVKETSMPPTSAEANHFTHPAAEGYSIGMYIDFEPKDDDVKIYYTLDGQDPIITESGILSLAENDDDAEDHTGKTYDLDIRPLIYDGSSLSVRYIAVKAGHSPSAVATVNIAGIPTSIILTEADDNQMEPEYFNMQGFRVHTPLAPGLYIRRHNGKTEKIIIR
ncbi:FN3 associated domain-containing protein [Duncaniella muris]|uniref:FN3 associated domain-containing protein n=1 Tax=Duncaniella muris TaxID=2094150 RepID=UPI0025A93AD8|nr:FN3 associated domain-containing protein [Duncaniella muris]